VDGPRCQVSSNILTQWSSLPGILARQPLVPVYWWMALNARHMFGTISLNIRWPSMVDILAQWPSTSYIEGAVLNAHVFWRGSGPRCQVFLWLALNAGLIGTMAINIRYINAVILEARYFGKAAALSARFWMQWPSVPRLLVYDWQVLYTRTS
jgi:hypothetical protein